MSDELLVVRCQLGEREAFAELVQGWHPAVERYVGRMLGRSDDDVVQEIWLAVFKGLPRLRRPDRFTPWLFTIARRAVMNRLRDAYAAPGARTDRRPAGRRRGRGCRQPGDVRRRAGGASRPGTGGTSAVLPRGSAAGRLRADLRRTRRHGQVAAQPGPQVVAPRTGAEGVRGMTPEEVLARLDAPLSLRRRVGYLAVAFAGLTGSALIGLLWATEPGLPTRTSVAFAVLVAIGLGWAAFGGWARDPPDSAVRPGPGGRRLARRRCLAGIHRRRADHQPAAARTGTGAAGRCAPARRGGCPEPAGGPSGAGGAGASPERAGRNDDG